jgi:recombination endonuclease VII
MKNPSLKQKICKQCQRPGEFYSNGQFERVICKTCLLKSQRQAYRANLEQKRALGRAQYRKHKEQKIAAGRRRYTLHRDTINAKERAKRILREYGISREKYEALLSSHDSCELCGISFTDLKTPKNVGPKQLDHDHETGRLRGVLCFRCNVGLAMYERMIIRVGRTKIARYLQKWSQAMPANQFALFPLKGTQEVKVDGRGTEDDAR